MAVLSDDEMIDSVWAIQTSCDSVSSYLASKSDKGKEYMVNLLCYHILYTVFTNLKVKQWIEIFVNFMCL